MTTYVGHRQTEIPGDLAEVDRDDALLLLLERMLGQRGHDAVPTAAEVRQAVERLARGAASSKAT